MDEPRDNRNQGPGMTRSGRVRIIGAEPAAQRAAGQSDDVQEGAEGAEGAARPPGDDPRGAAGRAGTAGQQYDEELPWPRPDDPWESDPELPHWTDAPTGEVPAVLRHDEDTPAGGDDPWSSVPPPSWREENLDWESHEGSFTASMLAEEEPPGMLDDTNALEQPWRFDIPAGRGQAGGQTYVPGAPGSEAQDPRAQAGDLGTPMHPTDLDEPTDTLPAVGRGPQGGAVARAGPSTRSSTSTAGPGPRTRRPPTPKRPTSLPRRRETPAARSTRTPTIATPPAASSARRVATRSTTTRWDHRVASPLRAPLPASWTPTRSWPPAPRTPRGGDVANAG